MKLYRLADAPISDGDQVFRHPPTTLMMTTIVLVIIAIMLTLSGGGPMRYFFVGLIAATVLFIRPMLKARRRRSNWLTRITTDGLLVQFRSYLNFHYPQDPHTVVQIPYGEIRSARVVKQEWRRDDSEGVLKGAREVVEIELVSGDVALEGAINAERARKPDAPPRGFARSSTRFHDYPVRLNGTTLQIEWTATPDANQFVASLADRIPR